MKKKPTVKQIKSAVLCYLDEKFESAKVIDDYRIRLSRRTLALQVH